MEVLEPAAMRWWVCGLRSRVGGNDMIW
jgi:hypothetical protein